jgi:hypothetical protein
MRAVFTLIGIGINFLGINPMSTLVVAGIVQGCSTPPLMLLIMVITNNQTIMGDKVNGRAMNFLGLDYCGRDLRRARGPCSHVVSLKPLYLMHSSHPYSSSRGVFCRGRPPMGAVAIRSRAAHRKHRGVRCLDRWRAVALRDAGADVIMAEWIESHGGAFWLEEFPLMVAWRGDELATSSLAVQDCRVSKPDL